MIEIDPVMIWRWLGFGAAFVWFLGFLLGTAAILDDEDGPVILLRGIARWAAAAGAGAVWPLLLVESAFEWLWKKRGGS